MTRRVPGARGRRSCSGSVPIDAQVDGQHRRPAARGLGRDGTGLRGHRLLRSKRSCTRATGRSAAPVRRGTNASMTALQCGGQAFESPQLDLVDRAVLPQGGRPESFLGPCRCADGASHPRSPRPLRCAATLAGVPLSMAGAGHRIEKPAIRRCAATRGCCGRNSGSKGVTVDLHSRPCALPVVARRRAAYRRRPPAQRPSRGPCPMSCVGPPACRRVASRAAAAPVPNAEPATSERVATSIAGAPAPRPETSGTSTNPANA